MFGVGVHYSVDFILVDWGKIHLVIVCFDKENDTLTLHFLLLPFDTPTWHMMSRVTMKEKMQFFLAFHP